MRISDMARRIVDFPDALAPKMPAVGSTLTGEGLAEIVSFRTTSASDNLVPSSERATSSQYERTFRAVNDRSALAARDEMDELLTGLLLRKIRTNHKKQTQFIAIGSFGKASGNFFVGLARSRSCDEPLGLACRVRLAPPGMSFAPSRHQRSS